MKPEIPAGGQRRVALASRLASLLVGWSIRRPRLVLALALLAGLGACWVVATRFALNTDVVALFPDDLPWRQTEEAMDRAFPQRSNLIAVVLDGATPDVADRAAAALAGALQAQPTLFHAVTRPDADPFFRRTALLFQDEAELRATTERIIAAQPLLGTLAADPSLRGVARTLDLLGEGLQRGEGDAGLLRPALGALATTAEGAAAGRFAPLDWSRLFTGQPPDPLALRRFVLVQPVPDYGALAPVAAATAAVRAEAARLGLTPENGVRVRLTGDLVMGDEEFSTVFGGAITENILSFTAVAFLLWLGLRSGRLIFPILGTLVLGLPITAAFGLLVVGPFNPLSIAFAVLFIGFGVDFGIQFAVSLREQRYELADRPLPEALVAAGHQAGEAIALAAMALGCGFLAFLPTDYRGVSELGLIAAAGMLVAVVLSLTALPAWLTFTRPRPEREPVGYAALAPLDRFLARHARAVAAILLLLALGCGASLAWLRFDTNPLDLRDPHTEAVSTFRELMRNRDTTPNTIDVLAPGLPAAEVLARRLAALPEVAGTVTLASFVPEGQEAKLALIQDAADLLGVTLEPGETAPPPDDATVAAALARAAQTLRATRGLLAAEATRLAAALQALADGPPAGRERLRAALVPGLETTLEGLRLALGARRVTPETLPETLVRDWIAPDGQARIEIRPQDLSDDYAVMARFARAVQAVAPAASGPAISIQASAHTIETAFLQAGLIATGATVLLLLLALRSLRLALLALAPLTLAGLLTLATCVAIGQPLNLANIIALPLLFAQGVAFKIYYVVTWQHGERSLLASPLTRAVLYSALTNGTAFGSLAVSAHPGTASMGLLLMLSLLFALAAVMLTLPALLPLFAPGRPAPAEGRE
ncbi:MMPL family transporter [Roseicella frigidaeris]|uniref:Hopanoid biosynthesis-associated RND transporter HpnN n=1 Tax=Roseicella frigidaeris TaxID=2230885 RepID=A0A327M6G7_9PROT|nr:MMPL family transporter [Roseicella frigidaeris]RAI58025.1 hopanoid biosynthesis-associated RND transporter HpnN [Roseicella frigidaeris]